MKKVLPLLLIIVVVLLIIICIKIDKKAFEEKAVENIEESINKNDIEENDIENIEDTINKNDIEEKAVENIEEPINKNDIEENDVENVEETINRDYSGIKDYNIEERMYNKIYDNIYYTNDFLSSYDDEEKDILLKKIELISEYLNENYIGHKVCIDRVSYIKSSSSNTEYNRIICNAYQITDDNVVLEDEYINFIILKDNTNNDVLYDKNLKLQIKDSYDKIDVSKFIDIEIIKKIAYKAIDENYNKMGVSSLMGEKDYYLGHEDGITYYCFSLGSSFIKIDAQKGNIIDEYYDTGRTY